MIEFHEMLTNAEKLLDFLGPVEHVLSMIIANIYRDIFANWNRMCAGALLAALPGIIFVFCAQKFLIRGLTAGTVKT